MRHFLFLFVLFFSSSFPFCAKSNELNDIADEINSHSDKIQNEGGKVSIQLNRGSTNSNDSPFPPFVATNEWQEVLPGQPVPAGLHYKMNVATGKMEAKLLKPEERKGQQFVQRGTVDVVQVDNHENSKQDTRKDLINVPGAEAENGQDHHQEGSAAQDNGQDKLMQESQKRLQAAFEKFKFPETDSDSDSTNVEQPPAEKRFRTIEELKQNLKNLNLNMTSETEAMGKLLERYKKSEDIQEKTTILNDLEYYLHQYDVANDFVKMNGVETISRDLKSESPAEIRGLCSRVLASGASGNPSFKNYLVNSGAYERLLSLLQEDGLQHVDVNTLHLTSAVFATARQHPPAQKLFLDKKLLELLSKSFTLTQDKQIIKLQLKLIDFMSDIMSEHRYALRDLEDALRSNSTQQQQQARLARQRFDLYEQVQLQPHVLKNNLCELVPKDFSSRPMDSKERVLKWMNAFLITCSDSFRTKFGQLQEFAHELRQLVDQDERSGDSSDYYKTILDTVDLLLEELKPLSTTPTLFSVLFVIVPVFVLLCLIFAIFRRRSVRRSISRLFYKLWRRN